MSAASASGGPGAGIVALEPGLLDEERAAAFLSRSVSWLRAQRQADHARQRQGEEPQGPPWVTIAKSVLYEPAALRAWIDRVKVPRGLVSFDKREPARPPARVA